MTFVPVVAQIPPRRIYRRDQRDFLDSQPALDALLALNCVVYIFEALKIDEAVELVFRGESRTDSCFVFSHPPHEIVGDACVQGH